MVSLPNEPDSPLMRVGDWGNEDVSQVDGKSGSKGRKGDQSEEKQVHDKVHRRYRREGRDLSMQRCFV